MMAAMTNCPVPIRRSFVVFAQHTIKLRMLALRAVARSPLRRSSRAKPRMSKCSALSTVVGAVVVPTTVSRVTGPRTPGGHAAVSAVVRESLNNDWFAWSTVEPHATSPKPGAESRQVVNLGWL